MSKELQFGCKKVTRLLQVHFFIGCRPSPPIVALARKQRFLGAAPTFSNSISQGKTAPYAAYGAVLYHLPTILPEIEVIFCAQDAHFCEKTFAARGPVCYYNG